MIPASITIHCTATKNGKYLDIDEIRRWHVEDNGWNDIGYHYVINTSGRIDEGRTEDVVGAHVKGFNKLGGGINIGIALVGNDRFTRIQFVSLFDIVYQLRQRYDIPRTNIWCHYEFPSAKAQGKTCPNIRVVDLMLWLIDPRYNTISKYLLPGTN